MKNYFICSIILVLCFKTFSQMNRDDVEIQPAEGSQLFVGEELTYVVKYAFFNLGEVRFKILEKTKINNSSVYKTAVYINSYPDLPFASIHHLYESYIDSTRFPLRFFSKIFADDTVFVEYHFIGDSIIEMQKGKLSETKLWIDSTFAVNKRMQDGLSILYYTRMSFGEEETISVPCFVNEKEESAILNFSSESDAVSIDAVDYEIDCRYLSGKTDFVSVYGLTGDFEGWFSNDLQSVPIRAKMNVIIGSINLELIKWNDKIWTPPLYKN